MTLTSRHRPTTTLAFDTGDQVEVALRQVTEPTRVSLIRTQLGLTDARVILEGRLATPRTLPATVAAGAVAEATWAGVRGAARLEPYQDSLTPAKRERFGQRVLLTFHSDEVPR